MLLHEEDKDSPLMKKQTDTSKQTHELQELQVCMRQERAERVLVELSYTCDV